MVQVAIICEGQTETRFVLEVLSPYLSLRGISVTPMLIATSPRHVGGALSSQRVVRFIRNLQKRWSGVYITTLFDLYGLPSDFPGVVDSSNQADPLKVAQFIQNRLRDAVLTEDWHYPQRFIPYIQPYEFEALLFSDVGAFSEQEPRWRTYATQLGEVRNRVPSPEHIDGGRDSHPSAWLQRLLRPRYRKARHGPSLAARIGIDRIRAQCQHFNAWLQCLENLSPLR